MIIFSPNTTAKSSEVNANFVEVSGMAGEIRMYGGTSAPTNWLLCQGQAISRTSYAVLYAIIGTIYGVGNGTSTFNLPDFGGNAPVGYKSGDANFGSLGAKVGAATVNLQHAHNSADHSHYVYHAHTLNGHTHSGVDHLHGTGNGGAHSHVMMSCSGGLFDNAGNKLVGGGISLTNGSYAYDGRTLVIADRSGVFTGTSYTGGVGDHNHGNTGVADRSLTTGGPSNNYASTENPISGGASTGNTSDSQLSTAQSVLQPSQTVNFIIKY
jgi:microcystin-dependent protein